MTEKRFNYSIDEVGVYYYVCDNTKKGDDKILFEFNTKFDAMEVCELLNELNEENKELQERNQRQAETIRQLYNLIENKDWETLTAHLEELKKVEEQLQSEWQTYGG